MGRTAWLLQGSLSTPTLVHVSATSSEEAPNIWYGGMSVMLSSNSRDGVTDRLEPPSI